MQTGKRGDLGTGRPGTCHLLPVQSHCAVPQSSHLQNGDDTSHSLQLEKAHVEQQRSSTAKKKERKKEKYFFKKKKKRFLFDSQIQY